MTADELKVVIRAEFDSALKEYKKLNKGIDSSISKLEKQANVAAKVGKNLTRYLTLPLAAAGLAAIKFAADIEQQEVAFSTLLGDVERGKKLFEDLKKFSAETPLQLEDIAKGSQALMAFGTAAEDVEGTMRMLGDASMGNAGKLDRLVSAYGKLQAKGRASLEELNMFTEAGVPIMAELAVQAGVTTEEMFKLISQGEVGFEDVRKVLLSLTGEGGKFHNMMKRMAETTAGKFSTALDNIKLSAAELGAELLPMANKVLDSITSLAQKFGELGEGTKQFILITGGIAMLVGPIARVTGAVIRLGVAIKGIQTAKILSLATNPAVLALLGIGIATGLTTALENREQKKLAEDGEHLEMRIAQALANAERSVAVYSELTKGYDVTLERVFEIAEKYGLMTDELRKQAALLKGTGQFYVGPLSEYPGGEEQPPPPSEKGWRQWFNAIAGTSLMAGKEQGAEFTKAFLDSLEAEFEKNKTFDEALGEFDLVAAYETQKEQLREVISDLLAIPADQIDTSFTLTGTFMKPLIDEYIELTEKQKALSEAGVELVQSQSLKQQMLEAEAERVKMNNELWIAYKEILEELAAVESFGEQIDPEYLAQLEAVNEQLEAMLGLTKDLGDANEDTGEKTQSILDIILEEFGWVKSTAEETVGVFQNVMNVLGGTRQVAEELSGSLSGIGQAMAEGASLGDATAEQVGKYLSAIAGSIATSAIAAGLRVIAESGLTGLPLGLGLLALGGITAIAAGIGGAGGMGKIDYGQMIIDEEEALAKARIKTLKKQLEDEIDLRNEKWRQIEQEYNLEFDVLRDLWERNLITTEEFEKQATTLGEKEIEEREEAEKPVTDKETEIEEEEEKIKPKPDIEEARSKKLIRLAGKAQKAQDKLDEAALGDRGWRRREIRGLNRRIKKVEAATTLEEIQSAQKGADFMTSGPQLLLVGDNPGGRERISVAPVSSPNIAGPGAGGDTYVFRDCTFAGPGGIDGFIEAVERRKKTLGKRGRLPA